MSSQIPSLKETILKKTIMNYFIDEGDKPDGKYDITIKNLVNEELINYLVQLNKNMIKEYNNLKNEENGIDIDFNIKKKKSICSNYFDKINNIINKYFDLFESMEDTNLISQIIIFEMITCDNFYIIENTIEKLINENEKINKEKFVCNEFIPNVLKTYLSFLTIYSLTIYKDDYGQYGNINNLLETNKCKVNDKIIDFFKDFEINDKENENKYIIKKYTSLKNDYLINYLINLNNDSINEWLYKQCIVFLKSEIEYDKYINKKNILNNLEEYKKIDVNKEMNEIEKEIIEMKKEMNEMKKRNEKKEEMINIITKKEKFKKLN